MKNLLLLIIAFSLCCQNQSYAQKNKDVALGLGALAVGAIAIAASIENNKEIYEKRASDYLVNNYNFKQFRLKMIGVDASKKLSDKGNLYVIPFSFIELEYGIETDNKKVLLAFFQTNQVNPNNVNFTNVVYELIEKEEWNSIICAYSMLNSPVRIKIEDNLVPVFNFDEKLSFKKKLPNVVDFPNYSNNNYAFVKSSNRKIIQYKRDEDKSFIDIKKLSLDVLGLYNPDDFDGIVIYPFFNLQGDDYLIADYSEKYKLISNENAMGIFLKKSNESLLLGNFIVNKIHRFINPL